MKYRGFVIEKRPMTGADFDFNEHGQLIGRKVRPGEWYFDVLDPIDGGRKFCTEFSMVQAKKAVDDLLVVLCMKDNTPKAWAKLEAL